MVRRLRTAASKSLFSIPRWFAIWIMVWWYRLGLTPNSSTRALWQPPVLSGGHVSRDISGAMFRVVFWVILPCKMIVDRRFRGAYCLHHQPSSGIYSSLMMEAVRTSETLVDNNFTRQYNPEDNSEHHTRRRENLKSHISGASRRMGEENENLVYSSP
jgi:hypothetical protein